MPFHPAAQGIDDLGGCSDSQIRGHETHLQLFQSGFIDLVGQGDDVFDAVGQGLAGARDGLLHAAEYALFFGFFQAAKKGLNHKASRYGMS